MPNIMITKRCNLSCPYCFANSFVNKADHGDMSMEVLEKILEFILRDGSADDVGLIGGEPSCHKRFGDILGLLAQEERLKQVTLFTNGVMLGEYMEQLANDKFKVLINCNEPSHMGENWGKLKDTLKQIRDRGWKKRVTLGINFYSLDLDYTYMLRLAELFQPENLRVSVSVPNNSEYAYEPLEHFKAMKPKIFSFFKELQHLGVIPFFDCNIFPPCLISVEEMRQFSRWGERNPFLRLKNHPTGCRPVIDIMDDLTAVRCFGLSEYTRVPIHEFATLTDLRNYYLRWIDAYGVNTYYDKKCMGCYQYKAMRCSGGCLVYKIDRIQKNRNAVEERNELY